MPRRGGASVYPIGVVEKLTGLTGRQIRYYEDMELLHPERTEGNQRLYSPAEVEKLKEIKNLLGQGMNLAGIRAYFEDRQQQAEEPTLEPEEETEEKDAEIRLGTRARLTSVYPVSNQAELWRVIDEKKQ